MLGITLRLQIERISLIGGPNDGEAEVLLSVKTADRPAGAIGNGLVIRTSLHEAGKLRVGRLIEVPV